LLLQALIVQELEARVHQLTEESEALQNSRLQLGRNKVSAAKTEGVIVDGTSKISW
jgi:uncharacterized small protein (DUF1192 family)